MNRQYKIEHISQALKKAREEKGLSQRDLSSKSGLPQGHISKIENGTVDLRLSSLIALARILDMELTLVPRKNVAAVNSIVRSGKREMAGSIEWVRKAAKELERIEKTIVKLPKIPEYGKEISQMLHRVREINNFKLSNTMVNELKKISIAIKAFQQDTDNIKALKKSFAQIESLRNSLAHSAVNIPNLTPPKPAYNLDEIEDG